MEMVLAVLPVLAFLACPIMMAFCFFGMRKMGGDTSPLTGAQAVAQLPEERVAALQQQLHTIQAELTSLQSSDVQPPQMDLMRVTVGSDGNVRVDTGQITQRSAYAPNQAVPYPA